MRKIDEQEAKLERMRILNARESYLTKLIRAQSEVLHLLHDRRWAEEFRGETETEMMVLKIDYLKQEQMAVSKELQQLVLETLAKPHEMFPVNHKGSVSHVRESIRETFKYLNIPVGFFEDVKALHIRGISEQDAAAVIWNAAEAELNLGTHVWETITFSDMSPLAPDLWTHYLVRDIQTFVEGLATGKSEEQFLTQDLKRLITLILIARILPQG